MGRKLRPTSAKRYAFLLAIYCFVVVDVVFAKLQVDADAEAYWFRRSIEANRNYPIAHFGLAAALVRLNSSDQEKAAARTGLTLDPSFTIRRFRNGLRPKSQLTWPSASDL